MELQNSITRDNLKILMTSFYEKVVEDEQLSYFFTHALGEDIYNEAWSEHIELLADFWLAILLHEGPYRGNFVGMHVNIPYITRESFARWLELFSLSTDEIYVSDISDKFKRQGALLAQRFISELNI